MSRIVRATFVRNLSYELLKRDKPCYAIRGLVTVKRYCARMSRGPHAKAGIMVKFHRTRTLASVGAVATLALFVFAPPAMAVSSQNLYPLAESPTTVAPPPNPPVAVAGNAAVRQTSVEGSLPITGTDMAQLAAIGVGAIGAGGVLLRFRRKGTTAA